MGLNLKDLVVREKTTLEAFSNKVIAIDAYNAIYQFLASIRGPDGLQLSDSEGRITSHLSGLLYRNVNFLSLGIKPVYVFDGKPPSLKTAEIERRKQIKMDATIKYEKAIADGNMEDARKYAQQTTSMKDGMVKESKQLLTYFGIPYIEAPSEGEATAAHLTNTGQAYASASQDFDSILCGAKRLVRNFTNSGRRKIPNKNTYIDIVPEIIETQKTLDSLELTREELIDVGILIGTDFNPNGFERVGPKTALKMIKQHSKLEEIPQIQEQLEEIDYQEIRKIFLNPEVADVKEIVFENVNYEGMSNYLVRERSFSEDRVNSTLNRLKKALEKKSQNLDQWF
ncbi:flap endonuclease-1 [Nitrosopumilus maritimus]|uniref:Flap endonuclease 1 n=1 Tax=Nitrosopumilus maritimus (strain SCM1) TaxID=436308 RepID=FEN_NITMS|nr:flap endonuclease-1 [Nitrosopumilus maritimus]A9A4B0.1 RecName: Full=Flap endonuclease 1; Short=FEN-1; AltName: Full=Flap structure-specific endonuclease 1 [Nitrosopumilus maritimus SCM1]ABX12599.1 XPG I domain protein [Nitrosopumilus maritimus SCM1]